MALEVGGIEEKNSEDPTRPRNDKLAQNANGEEEEEEEEGDGEEEEEDEPRLKYTSLTKNLRPLYRNGDATSAFLVAGDKMVRITRVSAGEYRGKC